MFGHLCKKTGGGRAAAFFEQAAQRRYSSGRMFPVAGGTRRASRDPGGRKTKFPMVPEGGAYYEALPTYPPRPSFKEFENVLRPNSQVVVFNGSPDDPYRASCTPLYQTSTFRSPSASAFGAYDYTRSGNPTRTALEKQVAMLDRATASFAFTSGMAALSQVPKLASGGEIVCGNDIYGGMYRLLTKIATRSNVTPRFVDTTDLVALRRVLEDSAPGRIKVLHLESPSNPSLRISDIEAIAKLCRERGIIVSVDATAMGPLLMRPLDLGAHLVVHSATKWLSGHADTMGGVVSVNADHGLAEEIAYQQNAEGTALAPFDCWLLLRGIKTLAIRQDRSMENARQMARFLFEHPRVTKLYWTERIFSDSHDGQSDLGKRTKGEQDQNMTKLQLTEVEEAIHKRQARGPGALISFETGDAMFSRRLCEACRIFKITVSFGSVNSLVEMPRTMSHASIPHDASLQTEPLAPDLVRLSVGIEDSWDLLEDLEQAFAVAEKLEALPEVESVKHFYKGPRPEGISSLDEIPLFGNPSENLLFDSKFEDLPVVPAPPSTATERRPFSEVVVSENEDAKKLKV